MLRRLFFLVAGLAAAVALGFFFMRASRPLVMAPVHRFESPPPFDLAAPFTDYAVATLRDETRYVLTPPRRSLLLLKLAVTVPPDRRVSYPVYLPPDFEGAKRVALIAHYRHGTIRTRLPLSVVDIVPAGKKLNATIALELPEGTAGDTVGLHVEGVALEPERDLTYTTAPVAIPDGAYLSFSLGISQPDPLPGAVEFVVKACDGDDCTALFKEVIDPLGPAGPGWHDRRVALDALAGGKRSLVFETRSLTKDDGSSFPLWGNPTVYAPARRPHDDVNIILLSIDTLAAQHTSNYGYRFDTTPFMRETFGQGGTVFERCIAAATTTPQSHMSMLSGLQPCVHGIITGNEAAPAWVRTIAEVLRDEGYETGAVTEDGWLGYQHGFGRGFNVYAENKSADIMAPEGQVDVTFARARRWLEENGDKRFFLFLHTFQVHDPYSPAPAYQQLFTEREGQTITSESPRPLRDVVAYDQEIRYTDDELKKLFAYLQQSGLAAKTVFILTSDHGEEFFEHGLFGHGPQFYEEVTHVPLMMWGPGRIPAGKRIDTPVGHVDLMPTILEMAGVSKSPLTMGQSLVGLLQGSPPAHELTDRPLYGESRVDLAIGPGYETFPVTPPAFLVQLGPRKLSRYRRGDGFEYKYYDLASDPGEQHNRFAENPPAVAQLQPLLDGYENLCRNVIESAGDAARAPQPQIQFDPATEDKLRALGYLK